MSSQRQVISVIDADPELAAGLGAEDLAVARRHAIAAAFAVPKGVLPALPAAHDDDAQVFGLLVMGGLILRETEVAGRRTAELLGAGDLIRPWEEDQLDPLPGLTGWRVLQQAQLAALDRRFAAVAGRYPALQEKLSARADARARTLSVQLALAQVPRVDARVLALLWRLADRWGQVTPDGVQLPLPLTHETLAKLVGARRPSVSTALGALADRSLVRRADSGYLLSADPAAALQEML